MINLLIALLFCSSSTFSSGGPSYVVLKELQTGNEAFVKNNNYRKQRNRYKKKQDPVAIVLSCSDSRVPPEIIFQQGVGSLFVVRVAGQVVDHVVVDSIEYVVKHFNAKVLIVMGHTDCGAVSGALDRLKQNNGKIKRPTDSRSHLDAVLIPIEKAIIKNKIDIFAPRAFERAIKANVSYVAEQLLSHSTIIAQAVKAQKIKLVTALYDVSSGKVHTINKQKKLPEKKQLL